LCSEGIHIVRLVIDELIQAVRCPKPYTGGKRYFKARKLPVNENRGEEVWIEIYDE